MTTTGYGDLTPDRSHPVDIVAAMLLMLSGTTLTGLFIAFGASLLTRVQWVTMQGLRPVHRRGHIVVCGAGSIGSEASSICCSRSTSSLVVIELAPDTAIVEWAREQHFDLLTGDASRDATLDLCNLGAAHGLIALTNVDTLNLEIALGARARNPTMPIVLRIAEASFAESIARHFEFETTYSAAALAGSRLCRPIAVSGFARSRGVCRSGVCYRRDRHRRGWPAGCAARRDPDRRVAQGDFAIAHDFAELGPGDRALVIVPIAPFREGKDTLAAAAERFLLGG